jgi:thioesterase domain-containing protein
MKPKQLERIIHQKIPLTRAMGLRVRTIGDTALSLSFPLKENINHLGTGFGGSIMAAQAVCCWGWYLEQMEKSGLSGNLVVKTSHNRFLRPVTDKFEVKTKGLSSSVWKKFISELKKNKSADFKLEADVFCKAKLCSRFTGHFVVKLK